MDLDPSQATPSEKIDYTLKAVTFRSLLILLFFIILFICILIWSFTGTIPISISGKCLLLNPQNTYRVYSSLPGQVANVTVSMGDSVKEGQLLLTIESQSLLNQQTLNITAPADSTVIEVTTSWRDYIHPGQPLLWMQKIQRPDQLTLFAFLPLTQGQKIREGMKVEASFSKIDPEKYGRLQGVVTRLSTYPIDSENIYLDQVPSSTLREFLLKDSLPIILAVIELEKDPQAPSGLKWTSRQSPSAGLVSAGLIGEAMIFLDSQTPISFLIPFLRKNSS